MRMHLAASALLFVASALFAQTNAPVSAVNLESTLASIDRTSQQAAVQVAGLRIDKWKGDGSFKQQAQSNADSLQRNMTSALPTLTAAVRTNPQDLAAVFRLYRNINALSEVFNQLTEAAGAFGRKDDFNALQQSAQSFDESRRNLGDYLESLTLAKEAELSRLRSNAQTAATVPARPKKVIVDNDEAPAKKSTKKKAPASKPK